MFMSANMNRIMLRIALLQIAFLSVTACNDDQFDFSGLALGVQSEQTSTTLVDARRIEVPALQAGDLFLTHSVPVEISNDSTANVMTYCVAYDTVRYHSRWVAFRFDGFTRQKVTGRSNEPFMDDPQLPARYYIGSNGFGAGIDDSRSHDRGHLCASNDVLWAPEANQQTFYMTNMSPQLSRFNQDYWVAYENKVQSWGRSETFADTLYVVKGGTIRDDQVIDYVQRINGKTVPVPGYYFMALLCLKSGGYSALGFWMEHKDYGMKNPGNSELSAHVVTIDQLEELTGIDFFHNLPDDVEKAVEATVNLQMWGL